MGLRRLQATYSPLQAGAAAQLDALQLAQMCAMGFPRTHAQHALAATGCLGAAALVACLVCGAPAARHSAELCQSRSSCNLLGGMQDCWLRPCSH